MLDNTDPSLDAVDALRAADIAVAPIGEELERGRSATMTSPTLTWFVLQKAAA